jgi:hypothetical protein
LSRSSKKFTFPIQVWQNHNHFQRLARYVLGSVEKYPEQLPIQSDLDNYRTQMQALSEQRPRQVRLEGKLYVIDWKSRMGVLKVGRAEVV